MGANDLGERDKTVATVTKTYFFLKTAEGQYLQAQLDTRTSAWRFWLNEKRAWTPCCDTREQAEQYRAAASQFALQIVEEAL